MIARRPASYGAAALKYDLLTMMGVTARYNWRNGEMTVGRREIARLWGVDERTVS